VVERRKLHDELKSEANDRKESLSRAGSEEDNAELRDSKLRCSVGYRGCTLEG
jgi:hypothetical protein